jgi:hypothetical protein
LSDYPFVRELRAPLTREQLRPLDPRCHTVQIGSRLSPSEIRQAAAFVNGYPHVTFRIYGHHTVEDLELLELFPDVRRFRIEVWTLDNFDGLRHLDPRLEELGIGATKTKRFSLRALERFHSLLSLRLEGQRKDFEALGALTGLRALSLRSVTLPDVRALLPLSQLRSLEIKLGGTTDLRLIPQIGAVGYLELWMVKGLADLSWLEEMRSLRYLFLQTLKHVVELPSFAQLLSLERVHVETMRGLADLSPIAAAPSLRELVLIDMPHVPVAGLQPFKGHPTLRAATIGLGSVRRNEEARTLLGLPAVTTPGTDLIASIVGRQAASGEPRCEPTR